MRYSPLFHEATRRARSELRKMFTAGPIGQLMQAAWKVPRDREMQYVIGALRKFGPTPGALRGMIGMRFAAITWTIQRYARREDDLGDLVRAWLESLGPAGRLLLALFGPGGAWIEPNQYTWVMQGAIRFLQAYGYEVLPRPEGVTRGTPMYERARRAAWEFLRRTEGITPPAGLETAVGPELFEELLQAPPQAPAAGPAQVDMGPAEGVRTLPADHPINTGKFQQLESSNVHCVAYDAQTGTLFVRFWQKRWDKKAEGWVKTGPGPIYAYYHVPPQMFIDLLDTRSKGGWIWDHLRIRGTVSGHQFDYSLVAVAGTYVPRKATFQPLSEGDWMGEYGEVFRPRLVQLPGGQWIASQRPLQTMRTFRPTGPIPPARAQIFGIV